MSSNRVKNHFLYLILRDRKFFIKAMLVVMIPTVIITYIIPKSYTVTTLIMPPENQSIPSLSIGGLSSGDFSGFFSGGMGFALPLMTTLSDVYTEILASRTMADIVILSTGYIDHIDLRSRYEENAPVAMYFARKQFSDDYFAEVTPSGFIKVRVTTNDPLYSVEISERVIAVLDSINIHINLSRLQVSRRLLEVQAANAADLLQSATEALLAFEDTYGVVELESEVEELITILMEMKGEYLELKASAQAIRDGLAHGSSAMLYQLDRQADAVREIIDLLEQGDIPSFGDDVGFTFSMRDIPDLLVEYARLKSDYEIALKIESMMRIQLRQAIAQEALSEGTIRLLDAPSHPGWKSKPKKLFIWTEVFLLAAFFISGFIVARDRIQEMKTHHPEDWGPWGNLLKDIRNDFRIKKKPRRHL